MVRPVVHSQKHYVQFPLDGITTATVQNIQLVVAVESTVANLATEIVEGSLVKAVYVELWLQNSSTLGESIVTVSKDPVSGTGPTFVNHGNLFAFVNKKNILFTHQGLTSNDGISGPLPVIRQWLKIPKSKQRFGLGDRLNLNISNVSSNNLNRCGFSTYKEYS